MPEQKYIFEKDDAIRMLITALKLLNLVPCSGHGEIRITFQDGTLLDTITTSERVRIKEKVDK